jgi:hypothetical protein
MISADRARREAARDCAPSPPDAGDKAEAATTTGAGAKVPRLCCRRCFHRISPDLSETSFSFLIGRELLLVRRLFLRRESTMQQTFIFALAVLLGFSIAHAQTSTTSSEVGRTNGSASSAASTDPEIPVQLPGEASNTSTQTAKTTTSASGSSAGTAAGTASSSTSCGPQVPSTDGGSVNLTEIAGAC